MRLLLTALFAILCVPLFGQIPPPTPDYTLGIYDTDVGVEQKDAEVVVYAHTAGFTRGLQISISYDSNEIFVNDVTIAGTYAETFEPDFVFIRFVDDGIDSFAIVGLFFDVIPPFVGPLKPNGIDRFPRNLEAGTDQTMLRFQFEVLPGIVKDTELSIELRDGLSDPPIDNMFIVEPTITTLHSQPAWIINPVVTVRALNEFIRGDFDMGGRLNIADSIGTLKYLFAGWDKPKCFDAADTNDDGKINIADALWGLKYMFAGTAPPAAPFPEAGVDPTTDDDLSCGETWL